MTVLAHFTAAEMPVTLAILLVGVIIGLVIGVVITRRPIHSRGRHLE
jgi:ribose/xylose/arabinose/galactoside ABC-type transport system permease subunit